MSNRDCYDMRSNNNTLELPKPKTNAMKKTFGYTVEELQCGSVDDK